MNKFLVLSAALLLLLSGCEQPTSDPITEVTTKRPLELLLNKTVVITGLKNTETNEPLFDTVRLTGLTSVGVNELIQGESITCKDQNNNEYIAVYIKELNKYCFLFAIEKEAEWESKAFYISSISDTKGNAEYEVGDYYGSKTTKNYTFDIEIY